MNTYDIMKAAPRIGKTATIAATLYSSGSFMKAKWVGAAAYARTANIVIANGGATIVFNYTGATADSIAGCGFASGICTTATGANDTVKEFVNLVNASTNWRVFPTGAIWSDLIHDTTTVKLGLSAQTTVNTDEGIDIVTDGSGVNADLLYMGLSLGITANKFLAGNKMRTDNPLFLNNYSQTGSFINCLTYIEALVTYTTTAAVCYIYDCDDVAQTETKIATLTPGATTVAKSWGTMQEALLSVPAGHRIVVRVGATTTSNVAGDYLSVIGYSYNPSTGQPVY